jgi:two-component system cell cycle sensor histidine kinase/response regulator CckA
VSGEILIAEDSPTQAEQLHYLLTEAGHSVLKAPDGEQALALARDRRPTLVITDVVMPRMDGYTLCRALKADPALSRTPVILLTSLDSPADVVEGLSCGADNFIRKPYEDAYLLARVDRVLAGGVSHPISATREQILDFLFSTFEETVQLGGELTRSSRALDGLTRIAEGLNRCTTEREVTAEALERVLELPGARAGWILIGDGDAEGGARLASARDFPPPLAGAVDCKCRQALRGGRPERAFNVSACEVIAGGAHACVPLRSGDRVVGVLNLVGPDEGEFGELALRTLDGVGNQIGAALERALLQEHLEGRVAERTAALTAEVAARQGAEDALRTAAAIVEASDDGMVRLAPDGRIETWNRGAAGMYGYTPAEIVGSSLDTLVPGDRATETHEILARVASGESVQGYETARLTSGGGQIDVSITLSPVRDAAGEVVAVAEIARDITIAKRLERQLLQSQKLDSVGRLAGGIAHDFNNLMTAVIGFSELALARLRADDPIHAYVEEIKRAGERATSLTQRLLAFGRRQMLRPEVVDLNRIVAEMEALLERLIGPDVELAAILAPDLWRTKVDRSQIEQVVMNLALNARDAMPDGGKLMIETANVELDDGYASEHLGVAPGPYTVMTVSDTGAGMDAETQTRIFEPFFTTKQESRGTGLGLSTVFGIVEQNGGSVWVYSEPGHGATFRIYLPRTEEQLTPRASDAAAARPSPGSETVLVVEDEEGIRKLVRLILEESGRTVLDTGDAREALALLRRHAGPVDLVITDMVMPGLSGRDVAAQIRASSPHTRVLFMSGYSGDAMVHRGLLRPGALFLVKPFTTQQLLDKVREALGHAG